MGEEVDDTENYLPYSICAATVYKSTQLSFKRDNTTLHSNDNFVPIKQKYIGFNIFYYIKIDLVLD